MKVFDPFTVALRGMHLIEASAGTGKTYTITSLYVRLLLERFLQPEQILVVTFTEAATKEIKDRVRARLTSALAVVQGEQAAGEDDFLAGLAGRYQGDGAAAALLINAIRSLDLAAIYTIHGFCKRLLADSAFESGVDFETEFVSEDAELLQLTVDDFWRIQAPDWGLVLTGYLYAMGCSSDTLYKDLQNVVRQTIAFGRQILLTPPGRATEDFEEIIGRLGALWIREREDIWAAVNSPALSQAKNNYCPANLIAWSTALDDYFQRDGQTSFPAEAIGRFSASQLAAHTKKKKDTPTHRFFELADSLLHELAQQYRAIRLACLEYCVVELPARKGRQGIMTYDDLLLGVRNGLQASETDQKMAEQVRSRYPAALIDEFQDTDPLQFEIFARLYRDTACCIFFIGDPKQAIYSFRGADIFAYLEAAAMVTDRCTLETNYRSASGLIKAVNHLFGLHSRPFLIEEIKFQPVRAAPTPVEPLCTAGVDDKPLTVWLFADQANRRDAKNMIARGVADKVAQLLSLGDRNEARLGERPLAANDMAVLVRTHADGEIVRKALQDKGIGAVIHSHENIFSSPEARELHLLLAGICNPLAKRHLYAALSSGLLGYRAIDLSRLEENEPAWESVLDRFVAYYQQWQEHGFAVMFRNLLEQEGVGRRLATQSGAERRLTNLRHLMDLLQGAVHDEGFGPDELLAWLQAKRHGFRMVEDEEQLRLESDEHLVTIATVHKSKGLEYPVVFCPFPWDSQYGKQGMTSVAAFHDDSKKLRIDLGTENIELHRNQQQKETLAEELRLLYVAVTRARNRCYLSWGRVGPRQGVVSEHSALGYLLHSSLVRDGKAKRGTVAQAGDICGKDVAVGFRSLTDVAPEAVGLLPLPAGAERVSLTSEGHLLANQCRTFTRQLLPSGTVQSFSGLQYQHPLDIEGPDHDAEAGIVPGPMPVVQEEAGQRSLFSFPRGRRAGSCLHAILENLDFTELGGENAEHLVAGWLRRFGFDDTWTLPVLKGITAVCQTPLKHDDETLSLSKVSKAQRLDELEFYYSVPLLPPERLRALFVRHMEHSLLADEHGRLIGKEQWSNHGYMKGFIDLVFEWRGQLYLVDYKSNHLGNRFGDYGRPQLAVAIAEARYDLQYYIYTVTLHRYLKQRLQGNYDYDRCFGGVFYLFLRGMQPEYGPEYGVYFDRPGKEIIESLDRCLGKGMRDGRDD
jgi:exodeoxyribonuclease V beta subunit